MAKPLKDILKGSNSTSTKKNDLGGYKPKAGDEQKFAQKHNIEVHADRNGNGDDVFKGTTKEAPYKKQSDGVYEAKKAEDAQCNSTPKGTACPIHGMNECMSSRKINEVEQVDELSVGLAHRAAHQAWIKADNNKPPLNQPTKLSHDEFQAKAKKHATAVRQARKFATYSSNKQFGEEVEQIDEVSSKLLHRAFVKARDNAGWLIPGDKGKGDKAWNRARKFRDAGLKKMDQERKAAKAVKEEVEQIDELDRDRGSILNRYISKTTDDPKRKAGRDLALQKKWGDKNYGTPEPKVKAVAREEVEDIEEKMTDTQKDAVRSIQKYRDKAGIAKPSLTDTKRTVKFIKQNASEEIQQADEACWDGYKKVGMKKKGDRMVPNCVPEETQVDEVLTKKDPAGKWIHDFVHSDNPKFAGKSKNQRIKQALGAYYSKQRNEEVEDIDELSKATMGSYVKKSAQDLKNLEAGREKGEGFVGHITRNRKQDNRTKGISRAVNKMTEDLAVPLLGGDPPRGNSEEAVDMVKTELKALTSKATHLVQNMPPGMHIEPWVQAKIAQAKSMITDVHDYCIYGDHQEEDEQTGPETPMTFPSMSVDVNTGRNV